MATLLKALMKQPYWVIALLLGVALVAFPYLTIKDHGLTPHPPISHLPVVVGIVLLLVSLAGFGFTLLSKRATDEAAGAGLDLTRVKQDKGVLWTTVGGCEIRIVNGRIEDYAHTAGIAVVLPCNEYFDDLCAYDPRSALGAYVARGFDGQVAAFIDLMKDESKKKLGAGVEQQKTPTERGQSFGVGRCVLITKPLDRSVPVALVSTTTQRSGEGLAGRISYLFEGTRELVARLADARLDNVVMPVLGAGHGGIDPPLALVGLLLAISEAALYGQGGQRLKRVTIVVFKKDADSLAEVNEVVVRRALALIGSD